jgi:anthranilate 3-monooxygenase (FAD) / 4-hydroxyphenylacetate 3-monooxygenase
VPFVPSAPQAQCYSALRNHTAHQTNTRAPLKLQFAVGLAKAVTRAIKADQFLHVQQMLGECLGYCEIVESALVRAEAEFETMPSGTIRAALAPLQALRAFLPTAYPRVIAPDSAGVQARIP